MNKCLEAARRYIKNMGICDMAALKCCLCSIGIIIGLFIPKKGKKPVLISAIAVFTATYIPLMVKLVRVLFQCGKYRSIDIS